MPMISSADERAQCWPNLRDQDFAETSPDTVEHNCIAFAAGDETRWWWPSPLPTTDYWPPGVPRTLDLPTFEAAFGTLRYIRCANGALEAGFEKIVIYVDANNVPTHAARQLPSGIWKSKLGMDIDVEHPDLVCLEGGIYGTVGIFMRRPVAP